MVLEVKGAVDIACGQLAEDASVRQVRVDDLVSFREKHGLEYFGDQAGISFHYGMAGHGHAENACVRKGPFLVLGGLDGSGQGQDGQGGYEKIAEGHFNVFTIPLGASHHQ
jgi:hypothetical protein